MKLSLITLGTPCQQFLENPPITNKSPEFILIASGFTSLLLDPIKKMQLNPREKLNIGDFWSVSPSSILKYK